MVTGLYMHVLLVRSPPPHAPLKVRAWTRIHEQTHARAQTTNAHSSMLPTLNHNPSHPLTIVHALNHVSHATMTGQREKGDEAHPAEKAQPYEPRYSSLTATRLYI